MSAIGEEAPGPQRDPQRLEVAGRRDLMVERRIRLGRLPRLRLPFEKHAHALADRSEHQRAQVDGACRLDARKRADAREKILAATRWADGSCCPGCTVTLSTRSGVNPRSTCRSAMKLRRTSPAATSRTTDRRNLDDEQRRAHAQRCRGRRSTARLPSFDSRFALPAWRSGTAPCHERHDEHGRKREERDGRVDGDVAHARQVIGRQRDDRLRHPLRDREAEHAARDRHEHDFGHPQPRDRAAGRAERQADAVFVAPPRDARQHQARDIGARDQQQHHDRGPQHAQRRTHRTEDMIDKRRRDRCRAPLQPAGIGRDRGALPWRRLRRARRPGRGRHGRGPRT